MLKTTMVGMFSVAIAAFVFSSIAAPAPAQANRIGQIGRDTINLAFNCQRHVPASQRAECLVCVATPRMHYHRGLPAGMRCHPVNTP